MSTRENNDEGMDVNNYNSSSLKYKTVKTINEKINMTDSKQ